MSEERSGKWYYYANERGCMKHPESLDEIGAEVVILSVGPERTETLSLGAR